MGMIFLFRMLRLLPFAVRMMAFFMAFLVLLIKRSSGSQEQQRDVSPDIEIGR